MQELVSVVIPVYNERRYLVKCVDSVLLNTWNNIEVILVDDGSDGDVYKLCDNIVQKDQRCRCIHQLNKGLSTARVTGFFASKGKWVTFVDNDDIVSPFLIEKLMNCRRDGVDIIAGQRIDTELPEEIIWEKGNFQYNLYNGKTACTMIAHDPSQKKIITPMWGKLYRREFLLKQNVEKYKKKCPIVYFEDVLMTPILYYNAKHICIIDDTIYAHREVNTSISRSGKLSPFYYDQIISGNILCEFLKRNRLKDMYEYQMNIYLCTILRLYCLMENAELKKYKNIIEKFYKKYLGDYIRSKNKLLKKMIIISFVINHKIWRKIIRKLYFKIS